MRSADSHLLAVPGTGRTHASGGDLSQIHLDLVGFRSRAGVGQGSMYHHFRGKAELVAVALQRNAEGMRRDGEEVFSAEGGVLDRLVAYLNRPREALKGCRIGRMSEDPDIIADPMLREPLDATLAWYRTRLAELLAEGQTSGELKQDFDPRQVAIDPRTWELMTFAMHTTLPNILAGELYEVPHVSAPNEPGLRRTYGNT